MMSLPRFVALFTAGVLTASAFPALAQPAAKPRAQAAAAPAVQASTARGMVKSVSETRLALDGKQAGSGTETHFVLDGHTVFQRLGKTLTAKDVKLGDPVTVTYSMRDGKAVASRVWVRPHGPAGAAADDMSGHAAGAKR